jgi:hypothetical protein
MKKTFALLLCAATLFAFAACGGSEAPAPTEAAVSVTEAPAETAAPTAAPTEAAPTETVPAPTEPRKLLENAVLFDSDDASFIVTKAEDSDHLGMQLHVQCVNKSSRTLLFSWDMVSVCGYMYDPMWAEEVAAGKTANSIIDLDTYALETMGIESVDEITFTLRISDSANWMDAPVAEEVHTIYPTGLTADTLILPAHPARDAQVVVAEDENIRFVIDDAFDDASSYVLQVYIENNTDRNLMYAWDLVSVNGKMIDPFWAVSVTAGKKACTEITFYRSELEANGITEVSDIEFELIVSDYDDWESPNLMEQVYTYNP